MRIALVSDIHGNLPALEAVVADIHTQGVDQIVCLGDNVSGPLFPKETAQYLMASGWLVLAGNHERQVLEFDSKGGGASDSFARQMLSTAELDWIRGLNHFTQFDDVFLCHGTPRHDGEHFLETIDGPVLRLAAPDELKEKLCNRQEMLVACGHSHVPRVLRQASGQLLINPGSVGLQAYYDLAPQRYEVAVGTPDAHYAIAEKIYGAIWQASIRAVPYDHESMAQLAAKNGRNDWAKWLQTGYV